MRVVSHGFRVASATRLSDMSLWPNCGVLVLPMMIAPAALRRSTATASTRLMMSFLVFTPVFMAEAVGAESGVWPLVE